MRSKTPQSIFFATNLSQIEPIRGDVMELAKFSLSEQRLQLLHAGMILEEMADHEHALLFFCQGNQLFSLTHIQTDRLFDINILAGKQGTFRKLVVQYRGGRD